MSLGRRATSSKCSGRGSSSLSRASSRTLARGPLLDPDLNSPIAIRTKKSLQSTDPNAQESCLERTSAPILKVPGKDAKNLEVREYLLNVLTKTGWGLAIDFKSEIWATVNNFVGNGYALHSRYRANSLQDICPTTMTTLQTNGNPQTQRISPTTRANIAECVMREMERYFEVEKTNLDESYGKSGGEQTPVYTGTDSDGHDRNSWNRSAEQREVRQFIRRPQSRVTLPEEWMSESLRARTVSRLSQHSAAAPGDRAPKFPPESELSFISKPSAKPMLVNITSVSKSQQTTDTAESDSLRAMEEREGSRIGTGPMSTRELRASLKNRYHTIRPSILPLPNNSSGTKALSRVKFYVDRATIRRVPSSDCVIAAGLQEVIATPIAEDPEDAEDAEDLKSSATSSVSAGLAGNGASAQSNVEEQDTRPNDNVGATSHETSPPSTEVSDETEELADSVLPSAQPNTGKDDTEEDADSLVSLSQRSTKNDDTAKLADTTPSPAHPDAGNSKPPEDARPDSPVEQAIKPPQKPPAAPGMITHWITHLPQNLTPIEMPLNPSPSSVPRSDADDVDAITTAIPKLYQGNTTRVNDIPVGREDQHGELPLDEVEVAEARVQTQEATAARQQVALGKDSELRQMKKRRYGFKRLWKKLRSKDGGGQTGNEA